jgi:hypothetical protein
MANPRGRPPLDRSDPSVVVCVAFPSRAVDVIRRRAILERVTVPELIRRVLRAADNKKIEIRRA